MVPEIDAWDIELLLAVKGLPWIVGEPTPQREFVSRLQWCRQSTSCRHLWENLRGAQSEASLHQT